MKRKVCLAHVIREIGPEKVRVYVRQSSELRSLCSKEVVKREIQPRKLGKRLRELRNDSGQSLREMGKLLGVSAMFLSDCESGHRTLGPLHTVLWVFYCEKAR